jgi:glycosyltransferase involved in cell wall biosynthesis
MGRLVEAKDYPSLFESIKLVNDKGFNIKLKVAGRGPLEETLLNLIYSLDMADNLELVGFQKPEEFLKTIDIFAMASVREGMPVALLEAMSYGLPVVATRVGGILEVISGGSDGLLSYPKQPAAMAHNIIQLVENEGLRRRLGKNARKNISQFFDIKKIAVRFASLYSELLISKDKN